MLILISPAKTLKSDFVARKDSTYPEFLELSAKIVERLKEFSMEDLSKLMNISPKLAALNYDRFQLWRKDYDISLGNNAIFTFRGEVFNGLNIDDFSEEEILNTQKTLRILSGLYGVLRPLDSILPYRLEMGTKLRIGNFKNLYQFWGDNIVNSLNIQLRKIRSNTLVNLASAEYFKSVNLKKLEADVITPVFLDNKNGKYKVISIYAKKARGLMTRFIIKNKISDIENIKLFDWEGYFYNEKLSSKSGEMVFTRG